MKYLFSLFKQKKDEEVEPSKELSPEEKIRSQYVIKQKTYADGHIIFTVKSAGYREFEFKSLEEAKKFVSEKTKERLARYVVNNEVVE